MSRPFILGLTGSIAMGKSTVAAMFADMGVPVFDADYEVRQMQGAGGILLEPIEAAFPDVVGPDGVDREKLGAAVFDDPVALARLETIVHPAVRAARADFLKEHICAPLVVFDIPLLFEKGGIEEVDSVLVVSASPDIQRARALARPDMTLDKFARILGLQMPDAEKRARADYIIDTGCSLEQVRDEVAQLVEKLSA